MLGGDPSATWPRVTPKVFLHFTELQPEISMPLYVNTTDPKSASESLWLEFYRKLNKSSTCLHHMKFSLALVEGESLFTFV